MAAYITINHPITGSTFFEPASVCGEFSFSGYIPPKKNAARNVHLYIHRYGICIPNCPFVYNIPDGGSTGKWSIGIVLPQPNDAYEFTACLVYDGTIVASATMCSIEVSSPLANTDDEPILYIEACESEDFIGIDTIKKATWNTTLKFNAQAETSINQFDCFVFRTKRVKDKIITIREGATDLTIATDYVSLGRREYPTIGKIFDDTTVPKMLIVNLGDLSSDDVIAIIKYQGDLNRRLARRI